MNGKIKELSSADSDAMVKHLLRLDPEARRYRFCAVTKDEYIRQYVKTLDWGRQIVLGYINEGVVRGMAEIGWRQWTFPRTGDLGISLESPWRRRGIGSELLGQVCVLARERFVNEISADCLSENRHALALLGKAGFRFKYNGPLLTANLDLGWPSQSSAETTNMQPAQS
jgi:RimJ/RimL family protein N-acetyltransferase